MHLVSQWFNTINSDSGLIDWLSII